MAGKQSQKGGKNRKYGRTKKSPSHVAYIAEGREVKNRKRRLKAELHKATKKLARQANDNAQLAAHIQRLTHQLKEI